MKTKTILKISILCLLAIVFGCDDVTTDQKVNFQEDVDEISEIVINTELITPRAVGVSIFGELVIEPQSKESIHKLGAPRCYGLEDDYSISADYDVVFKNGNNDIKIQELSRLEIISHGDEILKLKKVKIGDTELFYFIPRYTDCHALTFYLYGIDQNEAYPITLFAENSNVIHFEMYPNEEPKIINDRFVFKGGYGAGMDTVSEYYFKFDQKKHLMILEKVLQVKP
ncbi:hypothetical protein [Paenibacillus segetis]|uniref:Lipoprotein n=1 Tax=Paenibacillus segetis TaxID=1325360 RepID=A0ABQ1YJY6_9BACL|nr:hypothetical protein [Paenibacillus segetis]GGH27401.1 hypothetical protein GCM10008013_28830 [Paenibacillus segetis]